MPLPLDTTTTTITADPVDRIYETAERLATFRPQIAMATAWLLSSDKPERRLIPALRELFGLSAVEAIAAMRLAADVRREARRP